MAIESRTILLQAIGDTRNARRELERLEDKVRGLDGESEVSIRAETTRATRRLGEFEARLKTVDRSRVSPEVSVEIGKALADLQLMRSRLTALGNSKTKVDVEMRRQILRDVLDLERGILRMTGTLEKASRPARTFGDAMGDVVQTIKSVTPVVNGLAILIGIKLVSGLLAVGASAAAAVGGVVALGSALLAALGPAVALAIAVVQRIGAIFDVIKQQESAADQAKARALSGSSQRLAAQRAEEQAARQVADAQRAVGDAAEQVSQATVQAYEEMEQAAEDVQEAVERLAHAELGLDQARLDLKKAEQALRDFRSEAGLAENIFKKFTDVDVAFDRSALAGALAGSGMEAQDRLELEQLILDVRRAKQGEKDATDDLGDSERNLADARERQNRFARLGIAASPGYVSALRSQEDAQRNLRRAIADSRAGQEALIGTQAAAIVQAGKLSAAEERLRKVIVSLKTALRDVFSGATDAVISSIASALDRMQILFLPLKGGIAELGDAWAALITTLSKEFTKPQWMLAFANFFHLASQLATVLGGDVFIQFLRLIRNLALLAGPALVAVFRDFARWLETINTALADTDKSRPVIQTMIQGFRQWASFVGAVLDMLVALIETVGPIGNEFVGWITKAVKGFAKWLRTAEGQEEVKEFFEDTLPAVKSLLGFIFRLVKVFARVLQITSPLLKGFIDGINFVLDLLLFVLGLLQDIVHLPFVTWLLEIIGSFLAFGAVLKVVRAVFFAIARLGGILGILRGLGAKLIKPFVQAFESILRLVAKFAPNLAAKIGTAVVNAAKAAERKLSALVNFGRKIVEKIVAGIKAYARLLFDGASWIVSTLRRGFEFVVGKILAAGRFVVGKIIDGVKAVAGRLRSIGGDLLDGLIKGFTTIGKKAFEAIKGLVGKIVDAVKDFLGIHSPSRVMQDIGQQMLAGLIKGFTSGDVVGFIKDQLGGLPGLAAALAKKGLIDIPLKVAGELGEGALDLVGKLPGLAAGGIVTNRMFAELGEKGKEAVVPLTNSVLKKLGDAIAAKMTFPAPGAGAAALAGGGGALLNGRDVNRSGQVIKQVDVHLPETPSGSVDPRTAAVQLTRILRSRGG